MSRPDALRILGKTFAVEWVESFPDAEDGTIQLGDHAYSQLRIQVLALMPEENQRETLLHETLHAIGTSLSEELDEATVERLSVGLYAVAQESPGALAWMLGMEARDR